MSAAHRNYQYASRDDYTALSLHPRDREDLHRLIDDDAGVAWHDADGALVAYVLDDAAAPKSAPYVDLPTVDYLADLVGDLVAATQPIEGLRGIDVDHTVKLIRAELDSVANELIGAREALER